jgi:hypothetical protein
MQRSFPRRSSAAFAVVRPLAITTSVASAFFAVRAARRSASAPRADGTMTPSNNGKAAEEVVVR